MWWSYVLLRPVVEFGLPTARPPVSNGSTKARSPGVATGSEGGGPSGCWLDQLPEGVNGTRQVRLRELSNLNAGSGREGEHRQQPLERLRGPFGHTQDLPLSCATVRRSALARSGVSATARSGPPRKPLTGTGSCHRLRQTAGKQHSVLRRVIHARPGPLERCGPAHAAGCAGDDGDARRDRCPPLR